jgi:hypothetical protein
MLWQQPMLVGYRTSFLLAALACLVSAVKLAWSQLAVTVKPVTTAQELKAAIDGGAPNVHIINHLDLTTLTPSANDHLFDPGLLLQSMTVRLSQSAVSSQAFRHSVPVSGIT